MKKLFFLITIALMSFANSSIVQKSSKCSVDITMNKLESALMDKNLTIFARIDHKQNAIDSNMSLKESEVIIFGNPKVGTKIMQKDILSGLDLPLRILVYKDEKLQTKIAYHNLKEWSKSYNLKDCKIVDKIDTLLEDILKDVTSTPCGRK